jgi:hypothetical protein
MAVKGQTSRFSSINDTVRLDRGQARIRVDDAVRTQPLTGLSFPVAGYSPGTGQWLLLRYWQQHGRPASLALLPSGTVRIREDGQDTLQFQNRPLLLRRYVLKGLVWGNELLWTDQQGNLVGLITNDAEGDKLELLAQAYEALLPALIGKAAGHGMRLFRAEMPRPPPKAPPRRDCWPLRAARWWTWCGGAPSPTAWCCCKAARC